MAETNPSEKDPKQEADEQFKKKLEKEFVPEEVGTTNPSIENMDKGIERSEEDIEKAFLELKESEFWDESVPGIAGFTYGKMIEMVLQSDPSVKSFTESEWRSSFND